MSENNSDRSLTQIIKRNQMEDLSSRIEFLEEELKRKEILLIHLEKLSSLGQFIKEIIHELKNPLSAISGFTELGKIAKTKKDRENYLGKIPRFINQITSRLSQFRSATINSGIKYSKVDLTEVLAENLSALELLKPKCATIESTFKSPNLNILGDSEQWTPVFLSICRTFFNYMKEIKSTLKVCTEILSTENILSKTNADDVSLLEYDDWKKQIKKTSKWVKISFENNKIIIPIENVIRAINDGYHAEDLNQLSEIGIIIACDIVKRHHGNIYINKSKKVGFSLHILVPNVE